MAEYKFAAALNADTFPLVTRFTDRSVVIAGLDNRLKPANSGVRDIENENNPQRLPQVMYCENIMPTEEGVTTVGFNLDQAAVAGITDFDDVFILRNATESFWYFSPANGRNYVTPAPGTPWTSYNAINPQPAAVSVAYVNGVTYVCYDGVRLTHWDATIPGFVNDNGALLGLAIGSIRGIVGVGNYLVAFTDVAVWWSSLTNPLDFTTTTPTGAGTQVPNDVRGKIVALTAVPGGFIIHCAQNAIAAIYTNNSTQPWIFREIKDAGGIASMKYVSTDNNSGTTYIWGTSGLQQLNLREATNLFPAVTDFLAGKILETFDSATNLFTVTRLASNLNVKVSYIANRYLILSYGTTLPEYNYMLVYDNALRRWGKFKFDHVDCFDAKVEPRQSIAIVRNTGAVYRAIIDWRTFTDAGVLIMGKYQLNRTNQICCQELQLEVLDSADDPSVVVATSYDGTLYDQLLTMTTYTNSGNYRRFQKQIEGENLTFIIKGSFTLGGMLLTATKGAKF